MLETLTRKIAGYTREQCLHGIDDCHATLKVGEYPYHSPYAQKLWTEIDLMRARMLALDKWRKA